MLKVSCNLFKSYELFQLVPYVTALFKGKVICNLTLMKGLCSQHQVEKLFVVASLRDQLG